MMKNLRNLSYEKTLSNLSYEKIYLIKKLNIVVLGRGLGRGVKGVYVIAIINGKLLKYLNI